MKIHSYIYLIVLSTLTLYGVAFIKCKKVSVYTYVPEGKGYEAYHEQIPLSNKHGHDFKLRRNSTMGKQLNVLFGNMGRFASQIIRNQMIASYIREYFDHRAKATLWRIEDIVNGKKDVTIRRQSMQFDVCIGTKGYVKAFSDWCHNHGAIYVHDVVDNEKFLGREILLSIDRMRKNQLKEKFPYWSDIILVNTHLHRKLLRDYYSQNAIVLPHQHTNIRSQHSMPARFRQLKSGTLFFSNAKSVSYVGTVGFVFGRFNALSKEQISRVIEVVCCKHGMRLRMINQEVNGKEYAVHTKIWDYVCGGEEPVYHSFESGVSRSKLRSSLGQQKSSMEFWELQRPFHNHSILKEIDIGLLWPPQSKSSPELLALRPVTRLVHWWSHGIPTIFFPYMAYTETAEAYEYYKCDELRLLHLRYASSMEVVEKLLGILRHSPALRECLSAAGLRIAKDFSPKMIASRFVTVLERARSNG